MAILCQTSHKYELVLVGDYSFILFH